MADMNELLDAISHMDAQSPDTTLADALLLGFDTETTGIRPGRDAICSATLVLRDQRLGYPGDVIGEWVVNPHRPIPPAASRVNGFTDDFLQTHGKEPTEAIDAIATVIAAAQNVGIPLVAYNAPFDVHMIEGDLERWDLRPLIERTNREELLVIDPLLIDRAVSTRKGHRTLTDTTFYYGVQPHGNFHDATADTVATVDLIAPIARLHPQVGGLRLGEVMDWQREAYQRWRETFNRRTVSRGRTSADGWL
ncbi:DNA polymerase III subunit epsilon [Bifidobacterium margollesii]|uniref:DNA polymerase III subunit epsilon n=1 Tax=Bifidobacterium margollesii TaxID=2020964 RepID=A0A2N5JBT4_9BIFI|nr:exonuclease domain-containing protein [Bifidobacterium margollesii]PLS31651.1 DNA polymerase III subunit epsilon [Bifidobacterium margollesii]